MNVIFAIPVPGDIAHQAHATYTQLIEHIEGSSYGSLSSDCSNIVDIIKDNYKVTEWWYLHARKFMSASFEKSSLYVRPVWSPGLINGAPTNIYTTKTAIALDLTFY